MLRNFKDKFYYTGSELSGMSAVSKIYQDNGYAKGGFMSAWVTGI